MDTQDILASLKGHANAAAILEVLDGWTDHTDHNDHKRQHMVNMDQQEALDIAGDLLASPNGGGSLSMDHGLMDVQHTARWAEGDARFFSTDNTMSHLCDRAPGRGDTVPAPLFGHHTADFVVLGSDDALPTDRPSQTTFDPVKFERARAARVKAADKAAMPFLFDAKGRRAKLDGRQAKATMAKCRARMAD